MSNESKNPTDAPSISEQTPAPARRAVPLRRWSVADLIARAFAATALESRSATALETH